MEDEIEQADRILLLTSFQRQTFIDPASRGEAHVFRSEWRSTLFNLRRAKENRPFRVLFAGTHSAQGALVRAEGFRRAHSWNSAVGVVVTLDWSGELGVVMSRWRVGGERMACGLPVLVSENTAGPEVVRDCSQEYVVPIRDPQLHRRAAAGAV